MTWTWRLEGADGSELSGSSAPVSQSHSNQSDAESWLGENWRALAAAGVAQVSLLDDDRKVYGPMPLTDQ